MRILAIESSCDETAAAVVQDGRYEICSVVASSAELHEATGGVVPEVAARKQVEFITPVIEQTLIKLLKFYNSYSEGMSSKDIVTQSSDYIDKIAVTLGPGLAGSLVVGVEAAKTLAFVMKKPLIGVNHLIGHLYANFVRPVDVTPPPRVSATSMEFIDGDPILPAVGLLVSGGHTDLIYIKGHGNFEYLGGTVDDAAGECFDKCARIFGIAQYLGGAKVSHLAQTCAHKSDGKHGFVFPRPMSGAAYSKTLDMSFSGLKTAVRTYFENHKDAEVSCLCYELEQAIVDVLVEKTMTACLNQKVPTLLVGGGVSANSTLRTQLQKACNSIGVSLHVPAFRLCTDNAIYIAAAAYFCGRDITFNSAPVNPGLGIMD